MILVRRPAVKLALPGSTRTALANRQRSANGLAPGDPGINAAWARFLKSKARVGVAAALDRCFRFKCAYCENVAAQDIEHFYPKSLYPRRMFRWDNLLRGCNNCNNFKRDEFPLDAYRRPLLLDPCRDDPLDYFVWDFATGAVGVRPTPGLVDRGTATRDLLRLDLEPLREERRKKLLLVKYLLSRVVQENPVTVETRDRLRDELDPSRPWLGIVRQLLTRPSLDLRRLVAAARAKLPDIDAWTSPWM